MSMPVGIQVQSKPMITAICAPISDPILLRFFKNFERFVIFPEILSIFDCCSRFKTTENFSNPEFLTTARRAFRFRFSPFRVVFDQKRIPHNFRDPPGVFVNFTEGCRGSSESLPEGFPKIR